MKVQIKEILEIYNQISNNVRNKQKIYNFDKNKMQNIIDTKQKLEKGDIIGKYNIFIIKEPKARLIMSLNMKDKIINHYIARKILIPKLEKYLDDRNIATRIEKGTDYGIKKMKKYLEQNKKYDKFYILKIDISKYFYNIDHEVLKKMLKDQLTEEEYQIITKIIESTNEPYINEKIKKINKENLDIPIYKKNKGLPIGNMTSQFLSIYYLNKLDHYIIHDLKIKHYIRYMDDFVLIHKSKQYLKESLEKITKKLKEEYKLEINTKKTQIKEAKEGVEFLGYIFKIHNKKTIVKLRQNSIKRINKRIKEMKYKYKHNEINFEQLFSSVMNYKYSFKYGSYLKKQRIIDKIYE